MAGFKIAVYTSWGVKKRENTSVSAITIHGVVLSINNYYQAWCWDKEYFELGLKPPIEEKFIGQYSFSHHYALVTHKYEVSKYEYTKND